MEISKSFWGQGQAENIKEGWSQVDGSEELRGGAMCMALES